MELKEFLKTKAYEQRYNSMAYDGYEEDVEEHYNEFIERGCSYIYKVGAFAVMDGNKFDYAYVFFGIQRSKSDNPEYLGCFEFPDGENTDIGVVLGRALKCLAEIDDIFTLWR